MIKLSKKCLSNILCPGIPGTAMLEVQMQLNKKATAMDYIQTAASKDSKEHTFFFVNEYRSCFLLLTELLYQIINFRSISWAVEVLMQVC
jgi:hypothetical protein